MATTAKAEGGVQVLCVEGDLVAATVPQFRRTVEGLLAHDERDYIVDLGETTAIDSAGLEALTWLARSCEQRLGGVTLSHVKANLKTILKMTRLSDRFKCFETTEDAVTSFG